MSEYEDLLARVRGSSAEPAEPQETEEAQLLRQVRGQTKSISQANVYDASYGNPDEEAKKRRVSQLLQNELGDTTPAHLIDLNDADRRLKQAQAYKAEGKTAEFLANPENAKIAYDDAENLSNIEKYIKDGLVSGRASKGVIGGQKYVAPEIQDAQDKSGKWVDLATGSAQKGFWGTNVGIAGTAAAPFEVATQGLQSVGMPEWMAKTELGSLFRAMAESAQASSKAVDMPTPEGNLEAGVSSGVQSLTQNVLTLPAGVATKSYQAFAGLMSMIAGGQSYVEATEAGKTPVQGVSLAIPDAAAEYATEVYAGKALFDIPGVQSGVKAILKGASNFATKEIIGEEIATAWQDFNKWMVMNPEKTLEEYIAERPDAAIQTAIATVVGGGGQVALMTGVNSLVERGQKAQEAQQFSEAVAGLNQLAQASKVLERSQDSAQEFFQSVLEEHGTAAEVWISPTALFQSGLEQRLSEAIPEIQQQIQDAKVGNIDIRIPVANLMSKMAGPEVDTLAQLVSTEPGGFSQAEAAEYFKSGAAQELQETVERFLTSKNVEDSFRKSQEVVKTQILDEMNSVGRFTPQKNEADATLISSYYAVRAAQAGVTPEQLYSRRKVRFAAEPIGQQQLAQAEFDSADDFLTAFDVSPTIDIQAPQRTEQEIDDEQTRFLSVFPKGSRYTRDTGLLKRIRKSSDNAANDLKGNPAATRVNAEPLGPFSQYETRAVVLPGDSFNPGGRIEIQVFGKEQVEQGLADTPALTITVTDKGELSLNGPNKESKEFAEFQKLGWADHATGFDGVQQTGWTTLKNPENPDKPLPIKQLIPLLADVHARVKEWKMADHVGLHWSRATGALGGLFDQDQSAVYFQKVSRGVMPIPEFVINNALADAREVQDASNAFDLEEEIKSVSMNGEVDLSGLVSNPEYWDTENEEFTQAGYKEVDRLTEEKARDNLGLLEINELSDLDRAYHKAQYAAMKAILDGMGIEYTDTSSAQSKYLEVVDVKLRFADHANQVRDSAIRGSLPVINVAPGENTFTEALNAVLRKVSRGGTPPDLIVQHNLSADNLLHALKMGGIPVPSLAITKKDHPLTGFGEITLLGSKEMADPKGYAGTKVFGADIYSPRYPEVTYKLDSKALKNLNAALAEHRGDEREIYGGEIHKIEDLTQTKAFRNLMLAKYNKTDFWDLRSGDMEAEAARMLSEAGAEEKLFKGFDQYGNRRYTPHTLENVVKILKKELRGGEGFNYGVGSIRSAFTPQFRSIEQIRKAKDRLMDKEGFEAVKEEIDTEFEAIRSSLEPFHSYGNEFGFGDTVSSMMYDSAKVGVPRAMKENGFGEVPVEIQKDVAEFLGKLRSLPTQYFEAKILRDVDLAEFSGAVVPEGVSQKVLDALSERGIKDVRFYKKGDESDRAAKIGEFENLLFQGQGNRGAFNPETLTIAALKGADLTTILHEGSHFFFENDIFLASELIGKTDLTAGEQQIIKDVSILMNWHGIKGTPEEQLSQWFSMDFEERRSHHERTAESFEKYLFEGKAPSIELQPYFQKFRAWMVSVYKTVTEFLRKNPEAGKLNDEVRGVFDRMIATKEQIKLAEAGRSMMPLFTDQKKSGMTPEMFAAYQKDAQSGTEEAIEKLQSQGLKDMQWLHNARNRYVKKLQKESKAKRAEVEMEARKEVMSQPIYQAWQFLTGKIQAEDKIAPKEKIVSDPKNVTPEVDTLFQAIAKLGGIDRAQLVSGWGLDKEEKVRASTGLGGKRVVDRVGGMSIDNMGMRLAELGYLTTDKNGRYDAQEFETKFFDGLGGTDHYSLSYDYDQTLNPTDRIVRPDVMKAGRFDIQSVEEMGLPVEMVNHLKTLKMTAKVGIPAETVADMFGFSSADELIRTLLAVDTPKDAVNKLTDARMLAEYGELATQEDIERAADKAIHNEARGKFITAEANALAQAVGKRKILIPAVKEYAAQIIGKLKVRDIRPSQYASAETRSAKNAQKASNSGDTKTAAAEKLNQVISHYATRAAYDAQEDVEAGLRYLKRATSNTALKNMRGESKAQMLAILDRFDIRKSISLKEIDRQQTLSEWAESEAERLAAPAPILSEKVVNEEVRTHYKNLTVDEFRGLLDSIKQLEHLARREHKAYIAIRNMSLQEEVANAVAEIREAWPKAFDQDGKAILPTPLTHQYVPTIRTNLSKTLQHMNAEFVPMEELVDQLTAGKFGLLHDSLFGRLSNASDNKSIMAGEIRKRLKPFYDAYSVKEKYNFSRQVVGETGMTRENLLMLALYYGNVEGRQRLASQGFGDQQVMARISQLTEKDIALAEAIWSLNDEYIWPQYSALNERTQGKAPPKVQAVPMTINGRTLNGGYVKLVYDQEFDESTRRRDSMEDAMAMIGGKTMVAKTNQGSSKERIAELSKMPLLELRAVSQAVNEHMHDIVYREAVADTVRVLKEPTMRDAIKAVAGNPVYTELLAKVNEIAGVPRDPSGVVLKGLNIARKNTIVVLMSGVKTALVNYSGLIPALNRVNAGSLVKNIAKVHSWRMMEMIRFATESSAYMRERNQQYTSDLQHEMASLTVKNKLLPEMGTFLILMRLVDQVTSTSVWSAAYEDGIKRFKDHDRTVEYANNITRSTQGSGRDVDTSKIMERFGPWAKPFTMFYSFFNRQLALLVRQGVIGKNLWNSGRRAEAVGKFTAAYMTVVVIPALINDLAAGRCDKAIEGDEGWTRCVSKAIVMNMAGYIPVVRDFVPYVWGKMDDQEPNYSMRVTPITAAFEGIGSGFESTADVIQGEGDAKDTKAIFMGLAYTIGLPGLLLWNVIAGTESVINDDAPAKSVLFGPPRK